MAHDFQLFDSSVWGSAILAYRVDAWSKGAAPADNVEFTDTLQVNNSHRVANPLQSTVL
jgi:hypothetical protein